MKKESLIQLFSNNNSIEYFEDIDLTHLSTMRLKAKGDLAIIKDKNAIRDFINELRLRGRSYRLIGWGANQLLPMKSTEVYIKLDFEYDENEFKMEKKSSYFPASISIQKLISLALKNNIKGWELLTGIPASLGGAIFMNAGTRLGEISSLVKSVEIMKTDGSIRNEMITNESFSYRKNNFLKFGEIILGAVLKHAEESVEVSKIINDYLSYRKTSQPLRSKNCGCVFKNPEGQSIGKIIDELGMKGKSSKNFKISEVHANFIEHVGNGDLSELHKFIEDIKAQVLAATGLIIECEVQYSYN